MTMIHSSRIGLITMVQEELLLFIYVSHHSNKGSRTFLEPASRVLKKKKRYPIPDVWPLDFHPFPLSAARDKSRAWNVSKQELNLFSLK